MSSIWRCAGFSPFIISQFISILGDRLTTLAFVTIAAVAASKSGHSAGAASANVAAIQILPVVLFSYLGGMLSDKLPRKWLMAGIDVFRFLCVLSVFLLLAEGPNLYLIYSLVFVLGILTALFNPTKRSYVPFLVPLIQIKTANWWVVISEVAAMLLGIACGTLLLELMPARQVFLFDGLTFVVALLILLKIPAKLDNASLNSESSSFWMEIKTGWSSAMADKRVRWVLLWLNLPFYVAAGLFYAAANRWAAIAQPDNAGAALGKLMLALACGAMASFIIRKHFEKHNEFRSTSLAFWAGVPIMGLLAFLPLGWTWCIFVFTFLTGVSVGLVYARTIYLLHMFSPADVVGRVLGANELISGIGFAGVVGVTSLFGDNFSAQQGWLAASLVFGVGGFKMHRLSAKS